MNISRKSDSAKHREISASNGLEMLTYRACTSLDLGQSPFVGFLVFVVQRLDLLLLLAFTDLVGICNLEELGSNLD